MDRHELEQWLCGPDVPPARPSAIATALGLPAKALADTTLLRLASRVRCLRLTLALLHDAFPSDADVERWLGTRREELGGSTPRDAILSGHETTVEALAVSAWNESALVAGVG
jgi:hypothetical protein